MYTLVYNKNISYIVTVTLELPGGPDSGRTDGGRWAEARVWLSGGSVLVCVCSTQDGEENKKGQEFFYKKYQISS